VPPKSVRTATTDNAPIGVDWGGSQVVRGYCAESDTLDPEDQDFPLLVIK
jgi:hypothetical protein